MKNGELTLHSIEGKIFDGIRWSIGREKIADVWLDEDGASIRQTEIGVEVRFDAVVAGDLAVEVLYYLSGTSSDAKGQIETANDRLAGMFSRASDKRDELKATLDALRERMPAVCAALANENIEAHLVDTRLFDMVPTAIHCHLLPSTMISWRNEHGVLTATRVSGTDADAIIGSALVVTAGTDRALAERLLGLLASGSLGHAAAVKADPVPATAAD